MPLVVALDLIMQVALPEPPAFDTSQSGCSEADWLEFFATTPQWDMTATAILVVSPHPDDETLAAGGLMRAVSMRNGRVTVVSVTDGENARRGQRDLAARRRAELNQAMGHLQAPGREIQLARLGLPDGRVDRYEKQLTDKLIALAGSHELIVGPLECDGHADHEAVGRACIEAARATNLPLARYPIWAWHQADPLQMARYHWHRFELDGGLQRCKARAVACFRSQLTEQGGAAIVPPHVLKYFKRPFEAFAL